MAWRRDFAEAFWIDRAYRGLSGPPEPDELEGPQDLEPTEAVLVIRDRIGFRYERIVGLNDLVSQRDAAHLLGLPVMTVNRWVRAKRLRSRKRGAFTVVQLREVLRVAGKEGRKLKMKARLMVVDTDHTERHWI